MLTITHDFSRYTRAKLFAKAGNICEMFARFSTVAGESRSADTARDPRGFSLKFYTEEGNWDMVGNVGSERTSVTSPGALQLVRAVVELYRCVHVPSARGGEKVLVTFAHHKARSHLTASPRTAEAT